MFGTPVPEATVDEDGYQRGTEDEVCCPPEVWEGSGRYSVSQTHPVEDAAQHQFGVCVPGAVRLHHPSTSRRGGPRTRGEGFLSRDHA